MKTVIAHPQDALQEAAVTAILNALSVPYELGIETNNSGMSANRLSGQPRNLLELSGTAKGLWKNQAAIDQHLNDLREW